MSWYADYLPELHSSCSLLLPWAAEQQQRCRSFSRPGLSAGACLVATTLTSCGSLSTDGSLEHHLGLQDPVQPHELLATQSSIAVRSNFPG